MKPKTRIGAVLLLSLWCASVMADDVRKFAQVNLKELTIQIVSQTEPYSNGRNWRAVQEIHGLSKGGKPIWKFVPPLPPFSPPEPEGAPHGEPAREDFHIVDFKATEESVIADYVLGWNEGTAHIVLDTKTGKVVQMKRKKR